MAVNEYEVPENPYAVNFELITNELIFQEYLENYFEWNGWRVVREARPAGSECRADLLVEHDQHGWFGIETKFTNHGGRKMAEAHHQIITKYMDRTYFGHKIDLWVYAPFYYFYDGTGQPTSFVEVNYLIELTQGFFQRHGIGFLRKIGHDWEMQFELSTASHYVGIRRNSDRCPDVSKIRETVTKRKDQYSY